VTLQIVQDETADEVLSSNAFALLCGMLLQQEVPVDVAFAGPARILDRFGSLDPREIAKASPEDFATLCAAEPAVHPYPESMSVLIQAAARYVVVNYGGDTAAMWQTAGSGEHLLSRLMRVPGFNKRKAQMFMALLGKQLGVRPEGWEQVAGPYGQPDSFRSVADVRDPQSLEKVRNAKATRRKGSDEAGDSTKTNGRSAHNKESRGIRHVNTDEDREASTEEKTGRGGGKKDAAAKAAKRAANKERRRAEDLADPAGADERAAKRAARRAARAEGGGGKGRGGGNKAGGRGRNRAGGTDAPAAGDAATDAE
jgi:uncharacterized HhH-GPD family protein